MIWFTVSLCLEASGLDSVFDKAVDVRKFQYLRSNSYKRPGTANIHFYLAHTPSSHKVQTVQHRNCLPSFCKAPRVLLMYITFSIFSAHIHSQFSITGRIN